ncbi:hypothetical protein BC830DRAFT_165191 [Chytriomyces sp. MP71]|nr:hypothetical protein BC830DRAFT_165191 [Chytriomyces sp. MP71]
MERGARGRFFRNRYSEDTQSCVAPPQSRRGWHTETTASRQSPQFNPQTTMAPPTQLCSHCSKESHDQHPLMNVCQCPSLLYHPRCAAIKLGPELALRRSSGTTDHVIPDPQLDSPLSFRFNVLDPARARRRVRASACVACGKCASAVETRLKVSEVFAVLGVEELTPARFLRMLVPMLALLGAIVAVSYMIDDRTGRVSVPEEVDLFGVATVPLMWIFYILFGVVVLNTVSVLLELWRLKARVTVMAWNANKKEE